METPWEGPHRSVSPPNFAEEIAIPSRTVQLHDVTLRDGEECAELAHGVDAKVRIAEALAQLGIHRTELFLTVPGWEAAARAIIARQPPLDLYVNLRSGQDAAPARFGRSSHDGLVPRQRRLSAARLASGTRRSPR